MTAAEVRVIAEELADMGLLVRLPGGRYAAREDVTLKPNPDGTATVVRKPLN